MPELPEVETVRRGLNQLIPPHSKIQKVDLLSPGLRYPFNKEKIGKANNQRIKAVHRRAKYLLFELDDYYLVSHLGMTGSWRIFDQRRDHDHIDIVLEPNCTLTYRDPRRFGQFDILRKSGQESDRRFAELGPEPFDQDKFTASYLFELSRGRKTSVKAFLMNQAVVVGVGNIYASEALFFARVNPNKLCGKLSRIDCENIVASVKDVLGDAIECGGTTLSDFRQAGGSEGYFQNNLFVYGREGEPCYLCNTAIKTKVIVGRSTYWCPECQKG